MSVGTEWESPICWKRTRMKRQFGSSPDAPSNVFLKQPSKKDKYNYLIISWLNLLAIEYCWMLVIYSDDKKMCGDFQWRFVFFLRCFTFECTLMDTVEFFLFFFFSFWLNEAIRPPRKRNFLYIGLRPSSDSHRQI